jgi:hypothetical protein
MRGCPPRLKKTAVRDRVTAPDDRLKFCKLEVSVYAVLEQIRQLVRDEGGDLCILRLG